MRNSETGVRNEKQFLKPRVKEFALRIINLVNHLPKNNVSYVISNQLLRSGTSVGANYCSACRARSLAEFISKMGIVEEEADESIYWMELLIDAKIVESSKLKDLLTEADEILAIIVSSIKTAKSKN